VAVLELAEIKVTPHMSEMRRILLETASNWALERLSAACPTNVGHIVSSVPQLTSDPEMAILTRTWQGLG
jgi:hypothetical protein